MYKLYVEFNRVKEYFSQLRQQLICPVQVSQNMLTEVIQAVSMVLEGSWKSGKKKKC